MENHDLSRYNSSHKFIFQNYTSAFVVEQAYIPPGQTVPTAGVTPMTVAISGSSVTVRQTTL
jgi:hypothetical protein